MSGLFQTALILLILAALATVYTLIDTVRHHRLALISFWIAVTLTSAAIGFIVSGMYS